MIFNFRQILYIYILLFLYVVIERVKLKVKNQKYALLYLCLTQVVYYIVI